MSASYRPSVRRVVGTAAVPYGYTLVTATTAGMLMGTHGPPRTGEAFLFLAGAGTGFALAAGIGGGASADGQPEPAMVDARLVGLMSVAAAAAGLAPASLFAHAIGPAVAWAVAPLVATIVYFLVSAAGLATVNRGGR